MTKKELAERIDVDPKTLRNWEATKPELMKLIYLGLATEQHIVDVEKYLDSLQYLTKIKCN
jgi:DNA-binding XRE family transcriptional regulator